MSLSDVRVHLSRGKTRGEFTPDCTVSARMVGTAVDLFAPQNSIQYTVNLYGPYEVPAIK